MAGCNGSNGKQANGDTPQVWGAPPLAENGTDGGEQPCCPPVCATQPPLPSDIAWRWVSANAMETGAAAFEQSLGEIAPPSGVILEPLRATLVPSISAYYYPVPLTETVVEFPGKRLVMVKVNVSLTGLRAEWSEGAIVAPCVGALVVVSIARELESGPTTAMVNIRDVHPKHQEATFNELIGQETFSRVASSVSTTKQWNVSGGASYAGAGASASRSESTTATSERERSERNSRQTEAHHIQHVLTAYHVGLSHAAFTIQPRPFEGETWELVRGYRLVEGLQEFLVIAQVPESTQKIRLTANMRVGFRGQIVVDHPEPAEFTYIWGDGNPPDDDRRENWDERLARMGAYRQLVNGIRDYYTRTFLLSTPVHLIVRDVPLTADDRKGCYDAADPCVLVSEEGSTGNGNGDIGNYNWGNEPGVSGDDAQIVEATGFTETEIPSRVVIPGAGLADRRQAANATMADLFDGLLGAQTPQAKAAVPLHRTEFAKRLANTRDPHSVGPPAAGLLPVTHDPEAPPVVRIDEGPGRAGE